MLVSRLVTALVTVVILILTLVQRWFRASAASRRQLVPVMFAGAVGLRPSPSTRSTFTASGGEQPILAVTTVGLVLARAAVPVGFLLGLLRTQIDRSLVGRLVVELGGAPTPERIEAMVAATLHDPSVRVGYWSPAGQAYIDAAGHRIEPVASATRATATVDADGDPLCVIEHDAALSDDAELIAAVGAALRLAVDRYRLETMVRAQAGESQSLPRGSVSFLYSDIQGSTALLERLGTRYGDVLAETRRIHRAVVRDHGGREVDSRADEFFAVFPAGQRPRLPRSRSIGGCATTSGPTVARCSSGSASTRGSRRSVTRVMSVWTSTRRRDSGRRRTAAKPSCRRRRVDAIGADLPVDARLRDLGRYELRGIPGRHAIQQLVVPDLPADFPPLRLAATVDRSHATSTMRVRETGRATWPRSFSALAAA